MVSTVILFAITGIAIVLVGVLLLGQTARRMSSELPGGLRTQDIPTNAAEGNRTGDRSRFFTAWLAIAVAVGMVTMMAGTASGGAWGAFLLMGGPAMGALVFTLVVLFSPSTVRMTQESGQVALESRSLTSHIPQWVWGVPAATWGLLTMLTLYFGATANPDEGWFSGSFKVDMGVWSSVSSPYPGWRYSLPVYLLVTVLTLVAVAAAHRVQSSPLRGTEPQRYWQQQARSSLVRALFASVAAATSATIVPQVLLAANVTNNTFAQRGSMDGIVIDSSTPITTAAVVILVAIGLIGILFTFFWLFQAAKAVNLRERLN